MLGKKKKHPEISDPAQIEILFMRMIDENRSLNVLLGNEKIRCRVLDDENQALFIELSSDLRTQHNITPGQHLAITLYHEAKEIYGKLQVLGVGRYEGTDAIRLATPKILGVNDEFGLTNLNLFPRKPITFTTILRQFGDGVIVNIGPKGIDVKNKSDQPTRELFAVDFETQLGFELSPTFKMNCKGRVLYIRNVGEEIVGIAFEGINADTELKLTAWIHEEQQAKGKSDQNFKQSFVKKRMQKALGLDGAPEEGAKGLRLEDDYKTVLYEGDPKILILSKDEQIWSRIGSCLKRKYGILISKGRYSNVTKILEYYKPSVLLIDEELGSVNGFDLVNTLVSQAHADFPMIILGHGPDDFENKNKATSVGALDYWSTEPFRPLSFFKRLEEALELF